MLRGLMKNLSAQGDVPHSSQQLRLTGELNSTKHVSIPIPGTRGTHVVAFRLLYPLEYPFVPCTSSRIRPYIKMTLHDNDN